MTETDDYFRETSKCVRGRDGKAAILRCRRRLTMVAWQIRSGDFLPVWKRFKDRVSYVACLSRRAKHWLDVFKANAKFKLDVP